MAWFLLRRLRHCSPLKATLKPASAAPVLLLKATAIQPATAPLAGAPKYAPPEATPPKARSLLPVSPKERKAPVLLVLSVA